MRAQFSGGEEPLCAKLEAEQLAGHQSDKRNSPEAFAPVP